MLLCAYNVFSCKVFDGTSTHLAGGKYHARRGAGLLNHVTTHEFAGVLLTVCLRAELFILDLCLD